MLAERFQNLVHSIQRHGARIGLELKLTNDPKEVNFPLVFDAIRKDNQKTIAVVLAFPPTDPFLNSDVITFMVQEMRRAESLNAQSVLLFLDQVMPHVERAITYTGITNRALTLSYQRTQRGYEMDWVIAEPSAKC